MKERVLWFNLAFIALLTLMSVAANFAGINLRNYIWLYELFMLIPAFSIFLHAVWYLSFKRAILLLGLASLVGLAMEWFGLNYGTMFGGGYMYHQTVLMVLNMPLVIPVYWAVYIYTGYIITNSFLVWFDKAKPRHGLNNLLSVFMLSFIDAFIVLAIDLFMDPIEVKAGTWTWFNGGPYFGVPIGNFTGWYIIAFTVSLSYRIFEYFYPKVKLVSSSFYFIPIIGYFLLFVVFLSEALKFNLIPFVFFGSLGMAGVLIVNFIMYMLHVKSFKKIQNNV